MKISDKKLFNVFNKALVIAKKDDVNFIAISGVLDDTLAIEKLHYAYDFQRKKHLYGYGVGFDKAEWIRLSKEQKEELYQNCIQWIEFEGDKND